MSVHVELLVHQGGQMHFEGLALRYINGEVVECTFDSDFLCYFQLKKLGMEDLKYDSVEKVWFMDQGKTLADGLNEANNDADAAKIIEAGKERVVEVYLDTSRIESFDGKNEELESEWHNGLSSSDPKAEVSVIDANVRVVHLLDDSDRTSDPEFVEAMDNLGVSRFWRRVHLTLTEDGEELDQLNEATVNCGNPNPRGQEEIPMNNDVIIDMTNMASHDDNRHSSSDADDKESSEDFDFEPYVEDVPGEEVSFDEVNIEEFHKDDLNPRAVTNSSLSSCRNSSESDHDVDAKVDAENSTRFFAGKPWSDSTCDDSKLAE
ncbi:hypothetical protein LINPERHAP2_LOCUS9637 [Linum perenne]